jgi:hypothetical protein
VEGWIDATGLPPGVRGGCATRQFAGVSVGGFGRANFGDHCGDDAEHVARNRALLAERLQLAAAPAWLRQVHGTAVHLIDSAHPVLTAQPPIADACVVRNGPCPAVVLTADCLPLLIASADGSEVAAVHAGWRGLAAGVIEATLASLRTPAAQLSVWLGPAIGPAAFEVGPEVRAAMLDADAGCAAAFQPGQGDRWHADLYALARRRLQTAGVVSVTGGEHCTLTAAQQFHSYRRDGQASGRMASLVWVPATATCRSA